MKRIFQPLSILVITSLVCVSGCATKQAVYSNYYRKVDLDERYAFVGKHPVPKTEVKEIACYRFVYNGIDQLVKVEYLKAGRLREESYFGYRV